MTGQPTTVRVKRAMSLTVFNLLNPLVAVTLRNVPNPMVPGAIFVLNIIAYPLFGRLKITAARLGTATPGLAVETTIDIVAILLIIAWLGPRLYQTERW